jgi:hypothetical protein
MSERKFRSIAGDIDLSKIGKGLDDNSSDKYAILESCYIPFNRCIKNLIQLAICEFPFEKNQNREIWDSLETIKNIVKELDISLPHIMMARSYIHILEGSKAILERKESYFEEKDFSYLVKKDGRQSMIFNLVKLLRHGIKVLSKDLKKDMWDLIDVLVIASYKFNKFLEKYPGNYDQVTKRELDMRHKSK